MSISSEISRINTNILAAYQSVAAKGGTLPSSQNSANLTSAIDSIPTSSGSITLTANGSYDVSEKATAIVAIPVYDGSVS